eukprot:437456_1
MAQKQMLETDNVEGFKSQSKVPTLKEILLQASIPDDVYSKLVEMGIDWNELLYIENNDLDVLCGKEQLNLSFTTKLKFKATVKQIQLKYKQQTQPEKHVVSVTMKEQHHLSKIKQRFKNTENVQLLFSKHFNEIEENVNKTKLSIDHKFKAIIANINKRKQSLYKQIEEWKLKQLKNNDLNISYYMSISIALLTYAFITLTCIDIMEQWQHEFPNIMNGFLKLLHVLFIFCDCIIRIMPIILILQCKDTISWYYIVFGAQFMLYLEIVIWYEIYQYYPDFPMRKIYPFTYNALYNKCNDMPIISTPIPISHIAMQSQPNKKGHLSIERFDHSSYENPRYIENSSNGLNNDTSTVIILSPVSVSSDEISQTKYGRNY